MLQSLPVGSAMRVPALARPAHRLTPGSTSRCTGVEDRNTRTRRGVHTAASEPQSAYTVEELQKPDQEEVARVAETVQALKETMIAATTGVDRGLQSTVEQAGLVRRTAEQLEKVGGRVTLDWIARGSSHATLDLLGGTWRLVYSSAFENGNLGGSRPGPPAGLVPFSLGPIYQRVNSRSGDLDNVVELVFSKLPFMSEVPRLRLALCHSFSVERERTLRIVYDHTISEVLSGPDTAKLWGRPLVFEPPALQRLLPQDLRAATFDVTYLDQDVRITRGDRSELRVFVKDPTALGDVEIADPDTANTFSMDE